LDREHVADRVAVERRVEVFDDGLDRVSAPPHAYARVAAIEHTVEQREPRARERRYRERAGREVGVDARVEALLVDAAVRRLPVLVRVVPEVGMIEPIDRSDETDGLRPRPAIPELGGDPVYAA